MRTLASRSCTAILSLAPIFLGFACRGGDAGDETAPADSVASAAAEAPAGDQAVSSGLSVSSSSTYNVVVTNPMPHAMAVKVQFTGGGEMDLGTVPAGGDQSFTIAASAGETVTLVAADESGSHSPSTTMTLPEGATETTWIVE
jgi:hypothetical protein